MLADRKSDHKATLFYYDKLMSPYGRFVIMKDVKATPIIMKNVKATPKNNNCYIVSSGKY